MTIESPLCFCIAVLGRSRSRSCRRSGRACWARGVGLLLNLGTVGRRGVTVP